MCKQCGLLQADQGCAGQQQAGHNDFHPAPEAQAAENPPDHGSSAVRFSTGGNLPILCPRVQPIARKY
jgi:hypothetical protein